MKITDLLSMIPLPKLAQAVASLMSHRQLWKIRAEASKDPRMPDVKASREAEVQVLRTMLKNEEENDNENEEASEKQPSDTTKTRGLICFNCGKSNFKAADCYKAPAICATCMKRGHLTAYHNVAVKGTRAPLQVRKAFTMSTEEDEDDNIGESLNHWNL